MDFQFAQRMGLAVRQIALAEIRGAQLLASVRPALVPLASPLAQTRDNQNALVATGLHGGETVFSGRGAGGAPTSVAGGFRFTLDCPDARGPALAASGDGEVVCGGRGF